MFELQTTEEHLKALYDRAMKQKPNVDGVKAHPLGWVVEKSGFTEILVSFRNLEDIVSKFAESTVDKVEEVVETVVDEVTPKKRGRKAAADTTTETTTEESTEQPQESTPAPTESAPVAESQTN